MQRTSVRLPSSWDIRDIASPATMRRRVENLQALGIDAEFHLLPDLRHGFGLGIGTTAEGWEKDAVRFWEKYISRKN